MPESGKKTPQLWPPPLRWRRAAVPPSASPAFGAPLAAATSVAIAGFAFSPKAIVIKALPEV